FSAVDHAHQLDLGSPAPVKFTLRLTDKTSGVFQDFVYLVQFGGTISKDSAKVTATITPQGNFTDVPVGAGFYTLSAPTFTPPGPPESSNPSAISVSVDVRPVDVQKAPEPSTMLLSCVGLSFLGLASCRRRRRTALDLA